MISLKKLATAAAVTFALSGTALPSYAAGDLTTKARSENQQQAAHDRSRENDFKAQERLLRKQKAELTARRDALQKEADQLSATFSKNEDQLARLEEKLRLETGSLGEIFGVVRQNAKELKSHLDDSVTGADAQKFAPVVDDIVAAKSLPSMKQLVGLWHAMEEQVKASGHIAPVSINYINGDGKTVQEKAVRLGTFGLVTEQGYVNWNNKRKDAIAYDRQPADGPTLSSLNSVLQGDVDDVVLDPSHGTLTQQLALEPTLTDRLEAGGAVGNIIIALLVIGLIIAGYRGVVLAIARKQIKQQLKDPSNKTDNPLGRVLAVYSKEKNLTVEALELRLLEAVVDEQTHLERGLSMLKLLAALAPMLGLLGTVTGMIETFQVITQFGNGDPKVMAGGISMALVTTVLGLVAAMPLLLSHNVLSSQAESIRNILEKQGIGLVAEQAEKESNAKQVATA
ncbi:flagellar motor protein MotA [Vibrio sp. CAIM 722]|uniref:Flagellar motor protein MotA n=2 Tax=Vibrio TaxID=662 RepID=A0A7X4LKZ9_9VIBR|nr:MULTISPECIES: MotA/TolQ/ExbB proton channel family protein [Vibrio]MBF9000571.1 MotA/TolQ/ExbB proton channel family protein [Vibrio nitrifigilis]MZI93903.1 flagellar motor protein MotA [Vibrio eleionomae]